MMTECVGIIAIPHAESRSLDSLICVRVRQPVLSELNLSQNGNICEKVL